MLHDCVVIDEHIAPRGRIVENGSRAAAGFQQLGLQEGDSIALLMKNDFVFFEVSHAAGLLGLYTVPLNWHNKADELAYVIENSAAKAIVVHVDLIDGIRDVLPKDIAVFVTLPLDGEGDSMVNGVLGRFPQARVWKDWIAGFEKYDQPARPPRGSMIYTSGTTGRPKAVRLEPMSPEMATRFRANQLKMYGIGAGSRALILGPLYHVSPLNAGKMGVADADITVFMSRFDAEKALEIIDRHKITHIAMVPTMFVRLLKLPREIREKYDVSSLRGVLHTGGPCSPEIKSQMIEWWGPVINEIYGATEVGAGTFASSADWLNHPGTVGSPINAQVEILDEDSQPVPQGEVGEIYLKSSCYPEFTYFGNPQARAEVERRGMITIGDMGYFDSDGFLFLCDRKRDMVISGGVNIYPIEIENVLITHKAIADCAVFGIPDEEMGEIVIAAVQLAQGESATEDELKEFLRSKISNYKVPRRIEMHEKLPREDTGKIFKRKLRDPYWANHRAAI